MEERCKSVGLQLFIPRTKEHFDASKEKY